MHLRYDLQNKLNLTNFAKQASYFLNKENCEFVFYLSDFAVTFILDKDVENFDIFNIKINLSELDNTNKQNTLRAYNTIIPSQDFRFKELTIMKEVFELGSVAGYCTKNSVAECIDFMTNFTKILSKLNKLSIIA